MFTSKLASGQYVFCKRCITRNLGRKKFAEINESEEWSCFCCDPSQIYKERALMFAIAKWAADSSSFPSVLFLNIKYKYLLVNSKSWLKLQLFEC